MSLRPGSIVQAATFPEMTEAFHETLFAVVDVETTGLRPDTDRVIEVAVYLADGHGRIRDRWATLVRPDDRPLIGRLQNLVDAPSFAEIAGSLCAKLAEGIVAGHNVTFDLRLINAELRRLGAELPGLVYFDTHSVATVLDVDTPNRSLAVLCHKLGIEFTRWHTAESDVEATAALISKLLDRARNWGRVDIRPLCGSWWSTLTEWPSLPRTGRTMRRDPERFPPGGRQPDRPSVFKPSWRRFGTGEDTIPSDDPDAMVFKFTLDEDTIRASMIKVTLEALSTFEPERNWPGRWEPEWIEAAEYVLDGGQDAADVAYSLGVTMLNRADELRSASPVGPALDDWAVGGFSGTSGIERLELIVATLEVEGGEDCILLSSCLTLADLYRRHGGRHDDMIRTFRRGLVAAERRCREEKPERDEPTRAGCDLNQPTLDDWSDSAAMQCSDLLQAWWDEVMRQRDIEQLVELVAEVSERQRRFGFVGIPRCTAASLTAASEAGELSVAAQLHDRLVPRFAPLDNGGHVSRAVERFATALAKAGHLAEALRVCEQAWDKGYADAWIANRHSLILERSKGDFDGAAQICRLALGPPAMPGVDISISKRLERCEARIGAAHSANETIRGKAQPTTQRAPVDPTSELRLSYSSTPITVTGSADYQAALSQVPTARGRNVAELVWTNGRVAVRIAGETIGHLTPKTSAKFRDILVVAQGADKVATCAVDLSNTDQGWKAFIYCAPTLEPT